MRFLPVLVTRKTAHAIPTRFADQERSAPVTRNVHVTEIAVVTATRGHAHAIWFAHVKNTVILVRLMGYARQKHAQITLAIRLLGVCVFRTIINRRLAVGAELIVIVLPNLFATAWDFAHRMYQHARHMSKRVHAIHRFSNAPAIVNTYKTEKGEKGWNHLEHREVL